MGKYCYVYMLNPVEYFEEVDYSYRAIHKETETGKLLNNIAGNQKHGSYLTTVALAIYGVKNIENDKIQNNFGDQYNPKNVGRDPFFMICEERIGYLYDVITGNKYECADEINSKDIMYSKNLRLKTSTEIPPSTVVNLLKSLSKDEIERYCIGVKNLNAAIKKGYIIDMERQKNKKTQKQNDENFIKKFSKIYKKNKKLGG